MKKGGRGSSSPVRLQDCVQKARGRALQTKRLLHVGVHHVRIAIAVDGDEQVAAAIVVDQRSRGLLVHVEAVALDAELSKLGRPLDAALLVDVDPEVIVKRLTSRRMCRDCNYIGTAADETCPKCGGEMYQRDDDNEATVRNRLDVYEKSTAPLIDYYRGCDLLVSIDGDRDPNVVYADVKKALALQAPNAAFCTQS